MSSKKSEKWNKAVSERMKKNKEALLAQFRKMPILQIALERAGVKSRSTYYEWREKDKEFAKQADAALLEGELLINDMSESQLIALVRDKHFPSIQLWLRQHHPKYGTKVEITGALSLRDETLTPEEEAAVAEILRLTELPPEEEKEEDDNEQPGPAATGG